MGTAGWLLLVALGIGLGFAVGRLWPGTSARITEMERERDAAREDLRSYRQDVSQHFEHTAELFDKVTADYRGLYEHLALGARQLSAIRGESVELPLAEPEQRRLAAATDPPDESQAPGVPEADEAPVRRPSPDEPLRDESPEPSPDEPPQNESPEPSPEDRTHSGR